MDRGTGTAKGGAGGWNREKLSGAFSSTRLGEGIRHSCSQSFATYEASALAIHFVAARCCASNCTSQGTRSTKCFGIRNFPKSAL